jgi:hypothetical protein
VQPGARLTREEVAAQLRNMLQEQGIRNMQRYKLPLLEERLTSMAAEAAVQVHTWLQTRQGRACDLQPAGLKLRRNRIQMQCRHQLGPDHVVRVYMHVAHAQALQQLSQRKLPDLQHPAVWILALVSNVEHSWQFQGPTGSSDAAEQRRWEEYKRCAVHLREDCQQCACSDHGHTCMH